MSGSSRGLQVLGRLETGFVNALMAVAIAVIPAMALAITFEVLMRNLFNAPTRWVVDASGFGLVWVAFLAGPWLIRHHGHIHIDFAITRLSVRTRAILLVLTSLIAMVTALVLFWETAVATYQSYLNNTKTLGSWEIPRVYAWIAMPVGSLFMTLEFLRLAFVTSGEIRSGKIHRVATAEEAAIAEVAELTDLESAADLEVR